MKNFFLSIVFFFSTFLVFSQSKFNFVGIGFSYCDITDKNIKLESFLKTGPIGNVMKSKGFNHYEINLNTKTFIHTYTGYNTGVEDISKITNLVKTKEYIKFDVKTDNFGTITCVINLDEDSDNSFIVKYKSGENVEVAFFNTSPLTIPSN
jgi:hypothetical protein